jgi:hypothetical protein
MVFSTTCLAVRANVGQASLPAEGSRCTPRWSGSTAGSSIRSSEGLSLQVRATRCSLPAAALRMSTQTVRRTCSADVASGRRALQPKRRQAWAPATVEPPPHHTRTGARAGYRPRGGRLQERHRAAQMPNDQALTSRAFVSAGWDGCSCSSGHAYVGEVVDICERRLSESMTTQKREATACRFLYSEMIFIFVSLK